MVPGTTGYWEIVLDDVTVNGKSISSVKRCVVDSGTSLMAFPHNEIKSIVFTAGAKQLSILPPLDTECSIDSDASAFDIDFQINRLARGGLAALRSRNPLTLWFR